MVIERFAASCKRAWLRLTGCSNYKCRIAAENSLKATDNRLSLLAANAMEMLAVLDLDGRYTYVSPGSLAVCGFAESDLVGHSVQDFVHPEDWDDFESGMRESLGRSGAASRTYRRRQPDGSYGWFETKMRGVTDFEGIPAEIIVSVRDISERVRLSRQDVLRSKFFELLVRRNRLDDILRVLIEFVECTKEGVICSILLLDEPGRHLKHVASDRLPDYFIQAIDGVQIGPDAGACGAAAYSGQRVIVEDVQAHPNFVKYRELFARAGYRSCWSEPIRGEGGTVLGSVAVYRPVPSTPSPEDIRTVEAAAELASVAVLRRLRDDELQLALSIYNVSKEAILVTGPDNRILQVNPSFTAITGYEVDEILGQDPKILSAGRSPRSLYSAMWTSLDSHGHWQGEMLNRRKNGEEYYEWLTISVIYNEDGSPMRYVGIFADITEWKNAQDVIVRQANFDTLTGLPNRRLFRDRLEQEMKKMDRDHGQLVLMFIDLDHFKEVNDTLGHDAGDQLLIETSNRMMGCVRATDTVARLGGDEFAVILASVPNAQLAERIASAIIAALEAPFIIKTDTAHVSASIGITFFPDDAHDAESLMKNADQAMYAAKNQGRDRFSWFTQSMQKEAEERIQLANDLREALAVGALKVYYQPIIDLQSGKVVKAEALIRWHHPTLGSIPPTRFIPIAEETGQIGILGTWIFRQAAIVTKKWVDWAMASGQSEFAKLIRISVNKSPKQFHIQTTYDNWVNILHEIDLHPSHMVIEITENLFLGDHVDIAAKLQRFRDVGMALSLDDFGTGYSSLGYLKKYEVDYLKMDQSFVRGMMERASDRAIAEAILAMAQRLGLDVVAEGIEHPEQRDFLAAAGCRYGQGYLFWKPLPEEEFLALVISPDGAGVKGN